MHLMRPASVFYYETADLAFSFHDAHDTCLLYSAPSPPNRLFWVNDISCSIHKRKKGAKEKRIEMNGCAIYLVLFMYIYLKKNTCIRMYISTVLYQVISLKRNIIVKKLFCCCWPMMMKCILGECAQACNNIQANRISLL